MNENTKKELQSATFERLLKHLDERKDVQNIDIMNLAGFCRNCLSRWYREEAEKKNISIMTEDKKKEIQSATFERLLKHLDDRKDVQNIDLMNLANFCRNCLSRWYREEAEKKGITVSDMDARKQIYGMSYSEWKEKHQK